MSVESRREKELIFEVLREKANIEMCESIRNYNIILNELGFKNVQLPNLVIFYNNKIISLEKQFTKYGIDFYDHSKCYSRFIFEEYLQGLILKALNAMKPVENFKFSSSQINEFINSYRKPRVFEKIFKGAKYQPKNTLITQEQKETIELAIDEYLSFSNMLDDFSIEKDFITAIISCRASSLINGITDFDNRLNKIDSEIQTLGYDSILDGIKQKIEIQNLFLKKFLSI